MKSRPGTRSYIGRQRDARNGYLWRKRASAAWLEQREPELTLMTNGAHAVIERPGRKQSVVEMFCRSRGAADRLRDKFGGAVTKTKPITQRKSAPLRIGQRLLVVPEKLRRRTSPDVLVIPAGAAFGTGEHVTTAMSLRLLERCSRTLRDWSLLDLGTGSGILALAGAKFGAKTIVAIDSDPLAIKTAAQNAAANRVANVRLIAGDARKPPRGSIFDVITANLFSELLIEALPRWRVVIRRRGKLVLSGIMRHQEQSVIDALERNVYRAIVIRRRGKWIAILAEPESKTRLKSKLRRLRSRSLLAA